MDELRSNQHTTLLGTGGQSFSTPKLAVNRFDNKIVKWLLEEFKQEHGIDLKEDRQALQRLTEAAEKAKVELSNLTQTDINLPFLTATETGPKHLERSITRNKFEELTSTPPFKRYLSLSISLLSASMSRLSVFDENSSIGKRV